jgi:hypothetical protein
VCGQSGGAACSRFSFQVADKTEIEKKKNKTKKKNKKGGSFVKGKMERGDDEEGRSKTPLVILISYCLTLHILND